MKIEIFTKAKFSRKEEEAIIKKISGYLPLKKVKSSKLYLIEGDYSKKEIENIARLILCDPIVENYSLNERVFKERCFRFEISYKDGITDVVSQSVSDAIVNAGFKKPKAVKTGKVLYIFSKDKKMAKYSLKKIFVNELIHKIIG
jgi:phosphoribosylformylglycinamidine (FGAM) synthase PurS component